MTTKNKNSKNSKNTKNIKKMITKKQKKMKPTQKGGYGYEIDGPGYKKTCSAPRIMCNKEQVNFALCVNREIDCENPNYEFHYNPNEFHYNPTEKRIERNTSTSDVARFEVIPNSNLTEEEKNKINEDVLKQEELGRLKSYVPEFAPTSCFSQKKEPVSTEYRDSRVPGRFRIVTQNALGLYFGKPESEIKPDSVDPQDKKNLAVLHIMRLRTAYFRKFLIDNDYPDFLCFQEMTPEFFQFLYTESARTMSEMYPYFYPSKEDFAKLTLQGANATVMLISKYPALKQTTYMLQGNSSYYNALGVYEFEELVIFNVYLQAGSPFSPGLKYNWENASRCRRQQLVFIKSLIDSYTGKKAIVVLGDFNFELNSIHYDDDETPDDTDNWSELVFLKALGLKDSFKVLNPKDPGFTENTDINTLRYLGKLEEKKLRYDGIFFNDKLKATSSAVVNDKPLKLLEDNIALLEIPMPFSSVDKINEDYELALVFKPGNDAESEAKLETYKKQKSLEYGYELFVSDHFGVMSGFEFNEGKGGNPINKNKKTLKTMKTIKKRTMSRNKKTNYLPTRRGIEYNVSS